MVVKQILEKTGVFASFLLVTVLSVFAYSPTNGSNAAHSPTNGSNAASNVKVEIGTVLSVALSTDEVTMSGRPGDVVTSTPLTVYGYTNNVRGLAVLITDADDDTSLNHTVTDDKLTTIEFEGLFGLADGAGGYAAWDRVLGEDALQENQWGMKNSLSDAIIRSNTDRIVDYVYPIHKYSVKTGSANERFNWQVFGGVVMLSNRSNSMLRPGTYRNYQDLDVWGIVDDDQMIHEDIYFKAHLGRSLTSGEYSDTVLLTTYSADVLT